MTAADPNSLRAMDGDTFIRAAAWRRLFRDLQDSRLVAPTMKRAEQLLCPFGSQAIRFFTRLLGGAMRKPPCRSTSRQNAYCNRPTPPHRDSRFS
jgi:hypothetical protein